MKYLASLAVLMALMVTPACNRVVPHLNAPGGVVSYNTSKQLSSQKAGRSLSQTQQRSTGTSTVINTRGKAEVEIDTTPDDEAAYANEDVSETYDKYGRVDRYNNDTWE